MKTIFTLAFCLLGLTSLAQKKESLGLNLTKGATYSQTIRIDNASSQQIMGEPMKLNMNMNVEIEYRVKEKNGTSCELELMYKKLNTRMEMPGQYSRSFDSGSDNSVASTSMNILAALVDKPIQVKLDAKGNVLEVNNLDTLFSSLANTISPMELQQLKTNFGSDGFKQNVLASTILVFPGYPVAKGDSWVQEQELPVGLPMKAVSTYTYQGSKDGFWKITGATVIETPNKDEYVEVNGMQMKIDLTGTATSEFRVDKKNGTIADGKITMKSRGESHVKSEMIPGGGMTIKLDIETLSTVTGNVKK